MGTSAAATEADARPHPRVTRGEKITIALITAAFTLLLGIWAAMTPLFQAPDEATHYNSIVRLALNEGWPAPGDARVTQVVRAMETTSASVAPVDRPTFSELQDQHPGLTKTVDQMTQHPPTYYAIGALLIKVLHFGDLRWDISVIALRFMDCLIVAAVPLLTWATVRRVTRSPKTALVAACAVFAVPELASIGSSISNDSVLILAGAVVAYLGSRILTGDHRWRTVVILGLVLGAAALMKGTALPLIPFAALVVLLGGRTELTWRRRWLRVVVTGAITAAIGAWWWVRNLLDYHSLQPSGLDGVRPGNPFPEGQTRNFGAFFNIIWNGLSGTFWGQFGKARYPMTPILVDVLTVLVLFGIVVYGFRRKNWLTPALLALMPSVYLVSLLSKSWSTYGETQGIYGVQGRYLFPAIVAGITLSAIAWRTMFPAARAAQRLGRIVVVASAAIGLYGFSVAYRAFYQQTNLGVTPTGLSHLFYVTPIGRAGLAALLVLCAVAGIWALIRTWKACAATNGSLTPTALTPADPTPPAVPAAAPTA